MILTRLIVFSPETFAEPHAYLSELTNRASETRLSEQRVWHLLLHYQENLLGGYTSEVDDPGFFLSPNGHTDPESELQATLQHFFSDTLVGRSQQPAQCAFVARYRIGGSLTGGVVANLGDRWKVMASGSYLAFPLGDQSDDGRAFAGLRYTLGQHWALRFEFNHRNQADQRVFSVQGFF